MVLFIHQQGFDLQVFRAKGVRQIVLQGMRFATRQMNAQRQSAVQFVHKLTAMAARRVVHRDSAQGGLAAQPGVADGALFRVNGLLHGSAEKLHIAAKVPAAADAAGDSPDVKMRKVGARAGSGKRQ